MKPKGQSLQHDLGSRNMIVHSPGTVELMETGGKNTFSLSQNVLKII
jgi:hypothetical protein